MRSIEKLLKPGDCLLFSRTSLINRLIALKTWSQYTHVEVWLGAELAREVRRRAGLGMDETPVFASRNPDRIQWWSLKLVGGGVNLYPPDFSGLALVRRPKRFDQEKAVAWLSLRRPGDGRPLILGQPYDVIGLINFFYAKTRGRDNGAMFCSEAAARLYKKAETLEGENFDADATSPGMLAYTDALKNIFRVDPLGQIAFVAR